MNLTTHLRRTLAALTLTALCSVATAADANKASAADLDAVAGIGPSTSSAIIAQRQTKPFKDWADLKARVKGIGDARAQKLSAAGLTVNGQAYGPASATAAPAKKPASPTPAAASAPANTTPPSSAR